MKSKVTRINVSQHTRILALEGPVKENCGILQKLRHIFPLLDVCKTDPKIKSVVLIFLCWLLGNDTNYKEVWKFAH